MVKKQSSYFRNIYFLLIFLVSLQFCHAQKYADVDAIVSKYPNSFTSMQKLGNRIQKDFKTEEEKVRALYYWIAHNIRYDFVAYKRNYNGYKRIKIKEYSSTEEYHYKLKKVYAHKVLINKKAVCEGYSQLFFYLCEYLNIKAFVVKGTVKNSANEIGIIPKNTNHAWNAVFFNNKWHLIDATWSTGNTVNTPKTFKFNDQYFCIAPEKMILNHFPEDPKWQLLSKPISKKRFFSGPIFYKTFFNAGCKLSSKTQGKLKGKINGAIQLIFDRIDPSKEYYYTFNYSDAAFPMKFTKKNNQFVFSTKFEGKRNSLLTVYQDNVGILQFKVIAVR